MSKDATIIIYNDTGDRIHYFVVVGDYSHLDGVYLNMWFDEDNPDHVEKWTSESEFNKLTDQLEALIYLEDGGYFHRNHEKFPVDIIADDLERYAVIEAGFIA